MTDPGTPGRGDAGCQKETGPWGTTWDSSMDSMAQEQTELRGLGIQRAGTQWEKNP